MRHPTTATRRENSRPTSNCSYIQKHVAIVEELVGALVRLTTCKRSRPTVGLQSHDRSVPELLTWGTQYLTPKKILRRHSFAEQPDQTSFYDLVVKICVPRVKLLHWPRQFFTYEAFNRPGTFWRNHTTTATPTQRLTNSLVTQTKPYNTLRRRHLLMN